jgi:hypothetical protein
MCCRRVASLGVCTLRFAHQAVTPGPASGPLLSPPPSPQAPAPYLLAGYEDGTVALWDGRAPGRPLAAARLHSEPVMALALTPPPAAAGVPAAAAGGSGAPGPGAAPPPAAATADGGSGSAGAGAPRYYGLSGSADSCLSFFTLQPGSDSPLASTGAAALPSAGVGDATVRADGRVAATAHWDGRVRLWHPRRRAPLGVLRYHSKAAAAVAFSSGGGGACGGGGGGGGGEGGGAPQLLASGGRDGAVALWSVFN